MMSDLDYLNHKGHAHHDPALDINWQPITTMQTEPAPNPTQSPFIGKFYKLRHTPDESLVFQHLCREIKKMTDVHRVHFLFKLPKSEEWTYVIETSFPAMPRFVMGIVNADGTNPQPKAASMTLEALTPDILEQ